MSANKHMYHTNALIEIIILRKNMDCDILAVVEMNRPSAYVIRCFSTYIYVDKLKMASKMATILCTIIKLPCI